MKLNLCCGANIFPGWVNVDKVDMEPAYLKHLRDAPDGFVWPEPQRALAAHVKSGLPLEFLQYDVRRGLLLWETGTVDAIYIGQAIEHFNRGTEAPQLLRECRRVLKPGGAIRLTTPDLVKIVGAYQSKSLGRYSVEQPAFFANASEEDRLSYLLFGAMGPDCTSENYEGHFHIYSRGSLGTLLISCGFLLLTRWNGEESITDDSDEPLTMFYGCRDMGMTHSFAIQAVPTGTPT